MDQETWGESNPRFDARGTTGIAVWLPRECVGLDGVQRAMKRGGRLSEIVAKATRNWLSAHGAPDAWVQVAVQQSQGTPADNSREANAFLETIMRSEGPVRASAHDHLNKRPLVARWGADWSEGDVIWTVAAVVDSAMRDTDVRLDGYNPVAP